MPRYHVVRVSKYIGIYNRDWYAYAVADHDRANRTVSRKFDTEAEAQAEADRLEALGGRVMDTQCLKDEAGWCRNEFCCIHGALDPDEAVEE